MGYSTEFKGELKFTKEPTASQLAKLNSMFGEDCRDHPEWDESEGLCYIDLELTKDFSAIKWNGAEKTYDLDKLVNVVIIEMRKEWPEFSLTGELLAQGEDIEDRWQLCFDHDGFAHRRDVAIVGRKCRCPHCEEEFILEDN